jgi:membrane associated rhomboid family serine protease
MMDIAVKKLYFSMFFPAIILVVIWLVFLADVTLHLDLVYHGIMPRSVSGLQGVPLAPFIHGNIRHIIANSLPFFALASLLFYFYNSLAFRVILVTWLFSGIFVWAFGRSSYHVGISGVIYGLAGFLFVSGFIRRHLGLMAISFLVAFQYGSMVWGVLPIEEHVSWEGHLSGLASGVFLAWLFRNRGPKGSRFFWQGTGHDEVNDYEIDPGEGLPWNEYELEGPLRQKQDEPPKSPGDNEHKEESAV